jgi:hypothetical protein
MYGYLMNDCTWGILADNKHEALSLASKALGREVKWKEMHRVCYSSGGSEAMYCTILGEWRESFTERLKKYYGIA